MRRLSPRAELLLWIVGQNTERDWSTGELKRFFVPHASQYFYRPSPDKPLGYTYISGSGDANALKGLARRGLIERPRTSLSGEYIYALTEDGLKYLADSGIEERFGGRE
jgi:hypothetical protein